MWLFWSSFADLSFEDLYYINFLLCLDSDVTSAFLRIFMVNIFLEIYVFVGPNPVEVPLLCYIIYVCDS